MAAGDKIQGGSLMLWVYDSEGTAYKPIACITSNDIDSTAEIKETKDKCNTGKVGKEYGSISKSISVEGYFIDTTTAGGDSAKASHDWLEAKQDAKAKVDLKIATGLEDESSKFAKAIISNLKLTGPEGDLSTFSATLDVDGGWVIDPHA